VGSDAARANALPSGTLRRAIRTHLCASSVLCGLISCHAADREQPLPHTPAASPSAPTPQSTISTANALPSTGPALPPPAVDAPSSPATHQYVIAAIGDSLTDPRSHGGGYLEYLKTRCPTIEIDNFGKGATMVSQMQRSFQEQVVRSPKRYTHIVIFGGVNDLYSDLTAFRTPAKIEADLGTMYAWGKAHDAKVVALTVAPWGGFKRYFNASRAEATHDVNAWIRQQAARGRVDTVVDAYALLSCGDPDSLCQRFSKPFRDGIHFGPEGHQILGRALYREAFADCE
jgi:lysophospholipase L1-like esterase